MKCEVNFNPNTALITTILPESLSKTYISGEKITEEKSEESNIIIPTGILKHFSKYENYPDISMQNATNKNSLFYDDAAESNRSLPELKPALDARPTYPATIFITSCIPNLSYSFSHNTTSGSFYDSSGSHGLQHQAAATSVTTFYSKGEGDTYNDLFDKNYNLPPYMDVRNGASSFREGSQNGSRSNDNGYSTPGTDEDEEDEEDEYLLYGPASRKFNQYRSSFIPTSPQSDDDNQALEEGSIMADNGARRVAKHKTFFTFPKKIFHSPTHRSSTHGAVEEASNNFNRVGFGPPINDDILKSFAHVTPPASTKKNKWYQLFKRHKNKLVQPNDHGFLQADQSTPNNNMKSISIYNNGPLGFIGEHGDSTILQDTTTIAIAPILDTNNIPPNDEETPFQYPLNGAVRSPRMGFQALRKRYPEGISHVTDSTFTTNPILKSNGKYRPLIDTNGDKNEENEEKMDKSLEDSNTNQRSSLKRVHIGGTPSIIPYHPLSPISPTSPPHHRRVDEKAHTREAFRKNFYSKLSYLYALILISIGFSLPVSEAIAEDFPIQYHEIYYVYLYGTSICFFFYTYFFLIRYYTKTEMQRKASVVLMQRRNIDNDAAKLLIKKQRVTEFESSTGSFYLRMGALVFSVGSMIYSGLQFSEFFDSTLTSTCSDILGGVVPALNLLFTFIQTYFIFSHSKICIHKYKTLARFGLMHLVATNLCVWIITLVRQTIEEIEWFHHEIKDKGVVNHMVENITGIIIEATTLSVNKFDPKLSCTKSKRDIILSKIVEDAGPFLYPCTIEYSLICAAISYVMWKNIGEVPRFRKSRRSRHSYTVNCEGASRGLFVGLCVLVFSIITLILFFVLIERKDYFVFAVYLNQVTEIMVYVVALISIAFAFYKMRSLKFMELRDREKLDSLLLSIAVAGEYFFSMFSIVSTLGNISHRTILLLTTSLINVIESTAQTVFIVDALNRFSITEKDENEKPGRQFVTFLIICNFALWGFNTFANERTRTNPIQIEFYGYITWNIITHICTPLSIFYRYHSTACLAEVWKQAYKTRIDEFV